MAQSSLPTEDDEQRAIQAFERMHDGWSVDEVLLQDGLREKFFAAVVDVHPAEPMANPDKDRWSRTLIHVRKSGGRLPKATRRKSANGEPTEAIHEVEETDLQFSRRNGSRGKDEDESETSMPVDDSLADTALGRASHGASHDSDQILAIAEIAARRLFDELGVHTDALLYDSNARACFDGHVQALANGISLYETRKAALRLRKTRRLEPELLSRVTEWKQTIEDHVVSELRLKLKELPTRPGIYLFHDSSGYLYIGQANNLQERITKHLSDSDRKGLANYLSDSAQNRISLELHIFHEGSPGEDLRTRRAYESELIRTRKPRFNVAP